MIVNEYSGCIVESDYESQPEQHAVKDAGGKVLGVEESLAAAIQLAKRNPQTEPATPQPDKPAAKPKKKPAAKDKE